MRLALYFAPRPSDPLWRFGSTVLGYDAATGNDLPQFVAEGLAPDRFRELTADPRRYGFHATLKPPFALADGCGEDEALAAAAALAAGLRPLRVPRLTLRSLGPFLALVPAGPEPALDVLAAAATEALDPFRAPLTAADRARRRPERLSERQRVLLERWGYPYVLDEFRFHMTLTGPVPEELREPLMDALAATYAREVPAGDLAVEDLCVMREAAPGERFRLAARFPLGGAPQP